MRSLAVLAVVFGLATPAHAERPRLERVPVRIDPAKVPAVVNSKIIFLNRCAGGCTVTSGFSDSRTNKSAIGSGQLSAFPYGDTTWTGVVNCMKKVMEPFNVTVTDQDPGATVDHFEIMIAGSPGQIGLPNGIGGIAEYSCQAPGACSKYIPNALVFDFAQVWGNNVNELCATAAQEIAHTWTLDHVTDPSDPMTYFQYSGMRLFKDNVRCGSDCVNGQSPFGLTCTGNEHICMSTGTSIQNNIQITKALFGPAGAAAPTLKVTNPTNGSAQVSGFKVTAECTSGDGVQEIDIAIDGQPKAVLSVPPYEFTTPALTEGPHKVTVLCASTLQATTTVTADIVVGTACVDGGCATAGYICWDGACIAGPEAPGGLGATCTSNADCISGTCASDSTTSACTIPCDLDVKNCPDGFGCLDAGPAGGVCWAGVDDGGGCCDTSGGGGAGTMLLALGIAATFVTRKRRARA